MTYDQFLEALCLWREARNQRTAARHAVLAVIQNRVGDPRWPNTSVEVILQPRQFSSFNPTDPNATKLPNPRNVADWTAWLGCVEVVLCPLQADPTHGANHYECTSPSERPSWADPSKMTTQIGAHRFYKL